MKSKIALLIFLLLCNVSFAQKIPAAVKQALKGFEYVEGGSFIMGSQNDIHVGDIPAKDSVLLLNNTSRRVTVPGFWMAATEVTNREWREFYQAKVEELGIEAASQYLPDTSTWIREFPYSYNDPLAETYFQAAAFDDYPVVGVSWHQAKEYCQWKTAQINALLQSAGSPYQIPNLRLPTEAEWEYAALGLAEGKEGGRGEGGAMLRQVFPWKSHKLQNKKGEYRANFGPIIDRYGFWIKDFQADGYVYTGPVKSYAPNAWGLYQMAGNVREWVEDVAIPYSWYTGVRQLRTGIDSSKNIMVDKPQQMLDSAAIFQRLRSQNRRVSDEAIRLIVPKILHNQQVLYREDANYRIVKGGSWADSPTYMMCGSQAAFLESQSSCTTGFRMAMIHAGGDSGDKNLMMLYKSN